MSIMSQEFNETNLHLKGADEVEYLSNIERGTLKITDRVSRQIEKQRANCG